MEKSLPAVMTKTVAEELSDRDATIRGRIEKGEPTVFKMKAPLPSQGRDRLYLAATDRMTVFMTTYAPNDSGEIELHTHANEDHTFVVMQGGARFAGDDGEEFDLHAHEGILLPRKAFYRFRVLGEEPLVMMRIGCTIDPDKPRGIRLNDDMKQHSGKAQKNTRTVEYAEGAYFE